MIAARLLGLVLLLMPGAASAAEPATALPSGEAGRVTEVIDGDTVMLDTGAEVRLVGIQAPKLPLGRAGFRPWPLADEARVTLEALVRGRSFRPHFGGVREDRHGRTLAHLVEPSGIWLQGEMLRLGFARVYSFADNRALVGEMLALESAARAQRFGIWSHPFYAVRSPAETAELIGTFQIVEGRIVEAADVRGAVYLNFGADWRSDFTVRIDRRDMVPFTAAGTAPSEWSGHLVRVRGWLEAWNGPMIEASHPEQIEHLEEVE